MSPDDAVVRSRLIDGLTLSFGVVGVAGLVGLVAVLVRGNEVAGAHWAITAATILLVQVGVVGAVRRREAGPLWTPATALTLLRMGAIAALGGFLVSSVPDGRLAWAPAALYAVAVGLDFCDGLVARAFEVVTDLGARLDGEVDAQGLLIGAAVAALAGQLPPWYVLVGCCHVGFTIGRWWRHRIGRPLGDSPAGGHRRVLAGAQMTVIVVALAPVTSLRLGTALAVVAGVPFLLNYVRDWVLMTRPPT